MKDSWRGVKGFFTPRSRGRRGCGRFLSNVGDWIVIVPDPPKGPG